MRRFISIILMFVVCSSMVGCMETKKAVVNPTSTSNIVKEQSNIEGSSTNSVDPKTPGLEYLTQLPQNYGKDTAKKWPLILFLHGAGEVGGTLDDLRKMAKTHSIPKAAATTKEFPFVAISPLCPKAREWTDLHPSLINLLDEVMKKYQVDPERVYLTGLSMGGGGTWSLAMEHPERFAAIVPVCGYGNASMVKQIKDLPVWAFHGAKDDVISIRYEQTVVDALKAIGGNVKFTVYPEVAHDAWVKAYETPELYDWLLQHKRVKK